MHFLVVDDHPLYREALRSTVQLAFPGARIDEAGSIEQAIAALEGAGAWISSSSTCRCGA